MFDYQYGTITTKGKPKVTQMINKLSIITTPVSKALGFVFEYLTGLEVLQFALVQKAWYSATWNQTLWHELSKSIISSAKINDLYSNSLQIIEKSEKKMNKNGEKTQFLGTIRWKIVYFLAFYKFCSNCEGECKLKFLNILQKTLCYNCAKLPDFAMISLENAMVEYKITKEDISNFQLDGLRVPHTNKSGKYMFVYYLFDILKILQMNDPENNEKKVTIRKNIEERRKTEVVYYLKNEGVDDEFINEMFSIEGSLAHNYMLGKSQSTAKKIAIKLTKIFKNQQRQKLKKKKNSEEDTPKKKRKISVLTDDEKFQRKIKLIERLTLMGLDTDQLDFNDANSLACAYVQGKNKLELGIVAGKIWREFKPVFTGISKNTTQRIKDL